MTARRAFAAHPDAITDLRNLPEPIRDQALLHLQDLVNGERVATRLTGRLDGFHKVLLGVGGRFASHRLVVQFRPAPATSRHRGEVYLVAAGPRADYAVYRTAQQRTGRTQTPPPDPATAARIRAANSGTEVTSIPVDADAPSPPGDGVKPRSQVPVWREGLARSVLTVDYQRIVQVLADRSRLHQGPLTCQEMAAVFGMDVVPARVEGLRSKAERLVARGWLTELSPGQFTLAAGAAGPGSGS